ncbi:related to endonuclease/exonuclease/phosphatase family protein [Ramularia collo-cygni]|uniref:Related to endonuclease/exonuclease/phosphatase family protein n=1 Tax=Ramularia collo-cygni TaxID=112498 RepID=A0A2D3VGM8_9PEZI|nr:related to endonuclease/exonuclease/phosphatase family protein [Ramularia collo-cygni]CZT19853.1 related to endonuclease/exonuclease/phosphatase family protein [Ramularia collo-cygni]
MKASLVTACVALLASASAQLVNPTIASINGDRYLSPFAGQTITGLRGLVTAKGPNGFWIRSTSPDRDPRTSDSVYVFGRNSVGNVTVGDVVSLDGTVAEFRSNRDYLFLTEIEQPSNVIVVSSGNRVEALEIGKRGLTPPTELHTSLDDGDIFGVPNNRSLLSQVNPRLEPSRYGLDFWESLSGELVTVRRPRVLNRPNSFGDTWVVGNWPTTGDNKRGGLTITKGDGNPEAILIGSALDNSTNPSDSKLGDELEDITGVVAYAFGFYRILPTTAVAVRKSQRPATASASTLRSNGRCDGITVSQYNIENVAPTSANIPQIADHVVNFLKSPDLLILQEVQDDDGPTNTPIVDANITMAAIRDAITAAGSSFQYDFTNVNPVDDQEGGQPGGNIRNVYFYNPAVLRLANLNPGSSTQATEVLPGPRLSLNPGRIDPANSAWTSARVPLVAQWETVGDRRGSSTFFTVNVHMTSKGGSSSLHGDARPPVNNGVEIRTAQNAVVANFVRQILDKDKDAAVIVAGDFNEFAVVDALIRFVAASGLKSMDDVVKRPDEERYTYLFDSNSQSLDQMYVSPKLSKGSRFEHLHLNTWLDFDSQASDHDPSVAKVNVCK